MEPGQQNLGIPSPWLKRTASSNKRYSVCNWVVRGIDRGIDQERGKCTSGLAVRISMQEWPLCTISSRGLRWPLSCSLLIISLHPFLRSFDHFWGYDAGAMGLHFLTCQWLARGSQALITYMVLSWPSRLELQRKHLSPLPSSFWSLKH